MNIFSKVGAVLAIALLLCISPASALQTSTPSAVTITHGQIEIEHPGSLKWMLLGIATLGLGLGATVALTYETPSLGPTSGAPTITLGSTVPPTAVQASYINFLSVLVSAADADTSIVIVHNWGLSAADLTAGCPYIDVKVDVAGTATPTLSNFYTGSAANTLTITKANAAGSGGTYIVKLLKPNTMIR